ncbi:MAG TPA: helix-turn-helix transcriptional regulator [Povalibacter sp.]|nr:helix-turn-helix transcriptional regulator [Povalibacter sp.]HMN46479.1 helix-turn-helix transcriptional regulator [Povalibacter sp.]
MTVRKLRLKRGWTQEQLAELCGLSVRSIQRIERGETCSLETKHSLASVFGVEASAFDRTEAATVKGRVQSDASLSEGRGQYSE